jgi:hypothetical protein
MSQLPFALFSFALLCASLEPTKAQVIISEFLASNLSGLIDEDGDHSDWLEISNPSDEAINLSGWWLTDHETDLTGWQLPPLLLQPGEQLVVFASGKDRAIEGQELHTDFRLSASGEFLALVRPDGSTVESSYAPSFPQQYPDISYGLGSAGGATLSLVGADSPVRFLVPENSSVDVGGDNPFHLPGFDDSNWSAAEMGVGYATSSQDPYKAFIGAGGDLLGPLYRQNSSVYLRIPFTIGDPDLVTGLQFAARYDDGFAVYLNGSPILASALGPSDGVWDFEARASANHNDSSAVALQSFAINLEEATLLAGENILAVHGLNRSASSSDFLFDCELRAETSGLNSPEMVYFQTPSPGAENGSGVSDLGPVISDVTENPARPDLASQSALTISASVTRISSPVTQVTLFHRQGFASENSLELRDDGVSPDVLASDGIYTANLPLAGLSPGGMVRWRVEARDESGTTSKQPFFQDPLNSPEYFGTAAIDPSFSSDLPVLEWFLANPSAANSRSGTRAAVLHLGEFYDNVFCRVRGGSSAGLAKKSYKFDFNPGNHFRAIDRLEGIRAEEFNLNTTYTDKAYVRQPLTYEVYDHAGSPGPECFLMRVQQNGSFFSVAAYTEQVDKRLLRREPRMDDDGALYKMFNAGTNANSGVEKKNRRQESNADLAAFLNGMALSGPALEAFIFDNVDLPRQLNYLAATVLTQNNDNMSKNYYLYRDTEGSGEWTQLPWDTDLTWGSHFMTNDSIVHDGIWATSDYVLGGRSANVPISPSHPFVGIQELPGNRNWNRLINKLLKNERVASMFRRRLRTLVDEILMSPLIEDRLTAMSDELGGDAVLDRSRWGQFGQSQSLAQAMTILEDDYLAPRRTHLSVTHLAANAASYPVPQTSSALLPGPQAPSPPITIVEAEGRPDSGNQDEEYLVLSNAGAEAVDLSGWSLTGGIDLEFLSGTIIEGNGTLHVSPKVEVFRARAQSPSGGEGRNVEGNYNGQISARGETIVLRNQQGAAISEFQTADEASDAQRFLRITEMLFAPVQGKEFEFIELRNLGPDPLDLNGVQFTDGIEGVLSGTLAPGEFGLVVANPELFSGQRILGTFTGALNNGGEQVTLRDASGENILSFEYDGNWFSPSRVDGYSLVIRDESADWSAWDDQFQWAVSREPGGSPGTPNPRAFSNDYASWIRAFFTAEELDNPLISAPEADASGNGISNLMHYALGVNPKANTVPEASRIVVDGDSVFLNLTRLEKTPDLQFEVEVSPDLSSWDVTAPLVSSESQGDGTEIVSFRSPLLLSDEEQQYLRIRITRNP